MHNPSTRSYLMQTHMPNPDMLPMPQIARLLRDQDGRRLPVAVLARWCFKGIAGIRLDHTKIRGRLYTSRAALRRFVRDVASTGRPSPGQIGQELSTAAASAVNRRNASGTMQ